MATQLAVVAPQRSHWYAKVRSAADHVPGETVSVSPAARGERLVLLGTAAGLWDRGRGGGSRTRHCSRRQVLECVGRVETAAGDGNPGERGNRIGRVQERLLDLGYGRVGAGRELERGG